MNSRKYIYRKLHLKLTLLFTGISSIILIVMSLCYLYIAKKNLKDTTYLSFQAEMNTIAANLGQFNIITNEWLAQLSQNGKYNIAIYDNGTPLTYSCLNCTKDTLNLAEEILIQTEKQLQKQSNKLSPATTHIELPYTDQSNHIRYFTSVMVVEHGSNKLQAVFLYPTTKLQQKLHLQRIRFIALDISGILLLSLFAYFYTKKLLRPINESQKKQTEFIAAASHELRTPLAVILSAVTAIPEADENTKAQFLRTITQESNHMSVLVNDMLTLARSDSNTWTFKMEQVELDTLLLDCYETYEPLASKQGLSLKIMLPESPIVTCYCDRDRILQVLAILINNSISYSKTDGTITLKLEYIHNNFVLSVIDNGIGIPNEYKQHIFERFYRIDSSRTTKEHFGLGLCIAKEIINYHHGKIVVLDTPGGGTTFQVILQ